MTIRLQQCTCRNHHGHHRHHKQIHSSKRAKHARACSFKRGCGIQFKTRWCVALGTTQTIKINAIVTVRYIITTRSNQVQHDNIQRLKHFKDARPKAQINKYAQHPSLSRLENKLQYKTFNSTTVDKRRKNTRASYSKCPKKPSTTRHAMKRRHQQPDAKRKRQMELSNRRYANHEAQVHAQIHLIRSHTRNSTMNKHTLMQKVNFTNGGK